MNEKGLSKRNSYISRTFDMYCHIIGGLGHSITYCQYSYGLSYRAHSMPAAGKIYWNAGSSVAELQELVVDLYQNSLVQETLFQKMMGECLGIRTEKQLDEI